MKILQVSHFFKGYNLTSYLKKIYLNKILLGFIGIGLLTIFGFKNTTYNQKNNVKKYNTLEFFPVDNDILVEIKL